MSERSSGGAIEQTITGRAGLESPNMISDDGGPTATAIYTPAPRTAGGKSRHVGEGTTTGAFHRLYSWFKAGQLKRVPAFNVNDSGHQVEVRQSLTAAARDWSTASRARPT